MNMLSQSFYNSHAVSVAHDLIGQRLVFNGIEGIITETEAYRGEDDEASHAFRGKTPRSGVMFGPAGYSYVYFIYGMYHCLNIVTEPEGSPSAVLIRGLRLPDIHLNGPGKLCKYLGITKAHNGLSLMNNSFFCVKENQRQKESAEKPQATPRIGIKKSTDKLWRFVMKG